VGYGLEGVLTDARAHRIIAETIQPALGQGDIAGALTAGADRIMTVADSEPSRSAPPPSRPFPWLKLLLILAGVGLLLLFLWPLFETWYSIWPFYVLFPKRAERARVAFEARTAAPAATTAVPTPPAGPTNKLSNMREVYARMAERRDRAAAATAARTARATPGGSDALEALRARGEQAQDWGADWSSDDSGFDSGGGSGGGGGADSDY
jgi:uncharacterized membrane protein YgcG